MTRTPPARHVVLTGGEPMTARQAVELTERLRARGLHITIETAGTVFHSVACDLMSISPKLSHSTPPGSWAATHERLRLQPAVLLQLMRTYEYQLKFVVADPKDIEEIRSLLDQIDADRSKVILMPEGIDPAILHERAACIAEICKDEGFRFSPRLHVDLYGNRRGGGSHGEDYCAAHRSDLSGASRGAGSSGAAGAPPCPSRGAPGGGAAPPAAPPPPPPAPT